MGISKSKVYQGIYKIERSYLSQSKNLAELLKIIDATGSSLCSLRWSSAKKSWVLASNSIGVYKSRKVTESFDVLARCVLTESYHNDAL